MPLFRPLEKTQQSSLGLWFIDESYEHLLSEVSGYGFDISLMASYKSELKRRQWLGARMLLHQMEPEIKKIIYDSNGAPYLRNGVHISMSHSHEMVAVQLHKEEDIGIDIQHFSPKIGNIKEKFASVEELSYTDHDESMQHLVVIWSAKEAVYKRMKIEGLIFNSEIDIAPFDLAQSGEIRATVNHENVQQLLKLNYEILGEYTLVYISIP